MSSRQNAWCVFVLATLGLVCGLSGMGWIVGTFGVSGVTAQAIVKAVEVGSWGMFIVAIAATGGLVGAGLWGAVKLMLARVGSRAVVA